MHATSSPGTMPRPAWVTIFVLGILLAGCQAVPAPEAEPELTAPALLPPLPPLPVEDAEHYVVDGGQSDIRVLVYRGGPLAKYGHNHVIRLTRVEGDVYLAPDFHDSGFDLVLPLREVVVDPSEARADEGDEFATNLSPQAKEATLDNMLGSQVLYAGGYPEIHIRSVALLGPAWGPEATVRVTLHGVERDMTVPIAIAHSGDELIVTGLLRLRTSDFGMTPFSVLGGGLQVQDEVKVRFRIVARKE